MRTQDSLHSGMRIETTSLNYWNGRANLGPPLKQPI
jgi:hypothetical protein